MYSTNRGSSAKARGWDKKIAHPIRTTRRPRYIGLRLKRYRPEVTIVVVASGVTGLTVVFARRKATTPPKPIASPAQATKTAMARRQGKRKESEVSYIDMSHIIRAKSSMSATGGILSSKAVINGLYAKSGDKAVSATAFLCRLLAQVPVKSDEEECVSLMY